MISIFFSSIPSSLSISSSISISTIALIIISTILFGPFPVFANPHPYPHPNPKPEILSFGPNFLPTCAYQCKALYAAQYDCKDDVKCFCLSSQVKGLFQGNWACDEACTGTEDRQAVREWFGSVCGMYLSSATSTSTGSDKTASSTSTPSVTVMPQNDGNQASRQSRWWRNNWYWFLIAFLVITIPIAFYAFFFPARKWLRRKRIDCDQRRSLEAATQFQPPALSPNKGLNTNAQPRKNFIRSPSPLPFPLPPPIPEGTFAHAEYADPHSPALTRREQEYGESLFEEQTGRGQGEVLRIETGTGQRWSNASVPASWEGKEQDESPDQRRKGVLGRVKFWKNSKGQNGDTEIGRSSEKT